jgi:hypothetical protein
VGLIKVILITLDSIYCSKVLNMKLKGECQGKTKIETGITGWKSFHTEGRKNMGGKCNRGASG